MAIVYINCPPSAEDVAALQTGDLVYLSGEIVVTSGLPAHKRMIEYLDKDLPLPIKMEGVFIRLPHMVEERADGSCDIHYVNPTTSRRFDSYMPRFIRAFDLKIVGGKGGLGPDAAKAVAEKGRVYLSLLGGGSPILSDAIKDVLAVDWRDFPPHFRRSKMRVNNLGPLTVGIDARGTSIYQSPDEQAHERLPAIMAKLAYRREAAEKQI